MKMYIPDEKEEEEGVSRTTHLAISAHEDDIEFMAYAPIAECFGSKDKWFGAIVVTDGAGSPRSGLYADYTDEEMKNVRVVEQKKAAFVGEYSFLALLGHPSKEVKAGEGAIVEELAGLIRRAHPSCLYTHNLADKHETHVATALRVIAALRLLSPEERPKKVYGCEVWRDLDWLPDEEKVYLDCGGASQPHARAFGGVRQPDRGRKALRLSGRGEASRERDILRKPRVRYLHGAQLCDGLNAAHG